jgi:hypothetical protein
MQQYLHSKIAPNEDNDGKKVDHKGFQRIHQDSHT